MIKIGDLSKLSRVSVKTLRYYGDLGLLKPAQVDNFTGYRYYSADQLPRLNRILAFKDLGFSLEQIAQLLKEDLPAEQLRGMLKMKRAEIEQRLEEDRERLTRVEARLRLIERENEMPNYEVVIKKVEPIRIAAIRDTIPAYSQQGSLWNELYAQVGQCGAQFAGPCLTVYYDEEYKERDVDVEVCQPIGGPLMTVAMETATTSDRLNLACQEAYGRIQNAFAEKLITSGFPQERAQQLAMFVTAAIEGGIILSRINHTGDPLRHVADELGRVLETAK